MFAQRYSTPLRFATSIRIATAKGVLRPTLCNARATNAKPQVIPVGHLPQDKIGTSTSDIPSGNLSILILNRTSTAHDPNQHAENTHADRTQNTDHKPHTEHTQTQNTEHTHTHTQNTHTHTHTENTHTNHKHRTCTHTTQTHRHTDTQTFTHTNTPTHALPWDARRQKNRCAPRNLLDQIQVTSLRRLQRHRANVPPHTRNATHFQRSAWRPCRSRASPPRPPSSPGAGGSRCPTGGPKDCGQPYLGARVFPDTRKLTSQSAIV